MSTKKKDKEVESVESSTEEKIDVAIEPNSDFSPFDEPVKERSYTSVNIDPKELQGELEEPSFEAPSMSDFDLGGEEEVEEEPKSKSSKKEPPHQFNESYSELSGKEKKMGAEMMVEVVLDGYSKLKKGIGSLATISEKKLEREFVEGTIDPNMQLPIDNSGGTVGIRDFAKEFNEQSKEAFATSEEFKENVREPMIRVFKKRGLGMTDEQLLAYHFGTDLVTSGITAFGLKKSADSILLQLREQTDFLRKPMSSPTPTPTKVKEETPSQNQPKKEVVSEKTNKEEYQEPEEKVFDVQPEVLTPKKSNFDSEMETPSNMPEFGNTEILAEIEKIADKESTEPKQVKRGRGRPKKK